MGEIPFQEMPGLRSRRAAPLCVVRALSRAGGRFYDRFVPPASAADLGLVRIVVLGILLANALARDLPSVAELPPGIRREMGAMQFVHRIPGWDRLYSDEAALWWLKTATVVATLLAASGTLTRVCVPTATLLTLVHDGIFREYSHFFHTGLVPAYCGAVLSLAPCGDGWSVDSLFRTNRGREDQCVLYGWTRYAIWIVLAATYACAGMSKLRNGSLWWWHGDNLKRMVLTNGLHPDHIPMGMSGLLATIPSPFFSGLGIVALLVELLYWTVLVSRRARLILPVASIGLHLGILVTQGIPFFDLIAIQAVFLNRRVLNERARFWGISRGAATATVAASLQTSPTIAHGHLVGEKHSSREAPRSAMPDDGDRDQCVTNKHARGLILCAFLVCASAACWIGRVEWYPLTAWQMYSGYSPATRAVYVKVTAISEEGTKREIHPSRFIDAAPWNRDLIQLQPEQIRATFGAIKRVANEKRRAGEPAIVSLAIEKWVWDFRKEPNSSTFGHRVARISDSPSH
jgi:hypothetical protein